MSTSWSACSPSPDCHWRVCARPHRIDEMEGEADKLVAELRERKLVDRVLLRRASDVLGFIAWHQLFHLLEQMTDDANHCARLILSLARKEA